MISTHLHLNGGNMNIIIVTCIIVGTLIFLSATSIAIIALYKYTEYSNKKFEVNMMMADAQSKMSSVKPFNDLKETLNYIIQFVCLNEISLIGKDGISNEEVLNTLETRVADISAKCVIYLSDEFKRQFYIYANEEFLDYYIHKSVLINVTQMIKSKQIQSKSKS